MDGCVAHCCMVFCKLRLEFCAALRRRGDTLQNKMGALIPCVLWLQLQAPMNSNLMLWVRLLASLLVQYNP